MTAPFTVERVIGGAWHWVDVEIHARHGRLSPEEARELRDALDVAAADADPCRYPGCQNLAISAEFCGPHIEED